MGCSISSPPVAVGGLGPAKSGRNLAVTVVTLGGSAKVIADLNSTNTLGVLRARCAQAFEVPPGTAVQLLLGTHPLEPLGIHGSENTLRKLGIGDGARLTLFVQTCVQNVQEGTRIRVNGAGSAEVNGVYTCFKRRDKHPWDLRSDLVFRQEVGDIEINWSQKSWYFEVRTGGQAIYLNTTEQEGNQKPFLARVLLVQGAWPMYVGSQVTFDPVHFLEEIVAVICISVVCAALYYFRNSILLAISGDKRVHLTCLDCVWFSLCRCCGLCSGDWTRCLTRFPCCPRHIRGTNLVVSTGRFFGLTSYSVELKNIVVGDLPTARRGNFYLAVECRANPELVTSLAEEKLPKIVHFPEVVTLKLRSSGLEHQVRITVKDLRVVGSLDLCECFFNPVDVLDWSKHHPETIMRFEMRTTDHSLQVETPPWIALQFSQPTESRDLEHFHSDMDTVRTATVEGHCNDMGIGEFKRRYHLLDTTGSAIQEPLEDDLARIHRFDCLCHAAYWLCNGVTFLAIAAFLMLRFYIWSCWQQFRMLTVAFLQDEPFPVPIQRLAHLMKLCDQKFRGTGVKEGNTTCRPTDEEVLDFCLVTHPRLAAETGQPRPQALRYLILRSWGFVVPGLPCFQGVCSLRKDVAEVDFLLFGACVFGAFFACCCRISVQRAVRNERHHQNRERSKRMQTLHHVVSDDRRHRIALQALEDAGVRT